MKRGILLINLGTPAAPTTPAVRRYLEQFLMDPRVIDIPWLFRFLLVYGVIGPLRSKKSAAAYQAIWTEAGSPLLVHSLTLQQALSARLGSDFVVSLGMRYGQPSIQEALRVLQHQKVDHLTIIPLFPQYASASTGSALEATLNILATQNTIPNIRVIRDFYSLPGYIDAYADLIQQHIQDKPIDRILFSYHGLPERQIKKTRCQASCLQSNTSNPCKNMDKSNSDCYRAQCYETTRLIAQKLALRSDQYQVCFQSRLGRTPWIKPYTDQVLIDLSKQRVRNIAVVCPSFVSDCLETLEEINIRARTQWQALGGDSFVFIPCINSHPIWVEALAQSIRLP
ncbi:MAG: ferrochelatase [Gammaproteobacteria bacterium]|nr:ferrochelatase [Gammaproteobacteria bacterium]MBP9728774.1 ferrochelatase [Gammaproteobacteria bacterium]